MSVSKSMGVAEAGQVTLGAGCAAWTPRTVFMDRAAQQGQVQIRCVVVGVLKAMEKGCGVGDGGREGRRRVKHRVSDARTPFLNRDLCVEPCLLEDADFEAFHG